MGELINIYEIAKCLIRSKNFIPEKDVKINIMGLRKGEKLVEELFTEIEKKNLSQSKQENIFILKNDEHCPVDVDEIFTSLGELVKRGEEQGEIWKILKKIFPSLKV
jgi:FlaA1/EpsC-like NDP-sugar epimerase